jgi:hypothetical protein
MIERRQFSSTCCRVPEYSTIAAASVEHEVRTTVAPDPFAGAFSVHRDAGKQANRLRDSGKTAC